MSSVEESQDFPAIAALLRRDPELHLYELGDLDPFFRPRTRWLLGRDEDGAPRGVVLVYDAGSHACVLALGRPGAPEPAEVLLGALERLPARFYSHLQPGLLERLAAHPAIAAVEPGGAHLKLTLAEPAPPPAEDAPPVTPLTPADEPALRALYRRAYPENWFDPRMLETGMYSGVREGDRLVAAAGVHVFAPGERVAALGNITTDPERRGRGLAGRVTADVCARLRAAGVETIGLNVLRDNRAAIRVYRRLGFREAGAYDEAWVSLAPRPGSA